MHERWGFVAMCLLKGQKVNDKFAAPRHFLFTLLPLGVFFTFILSWGGGGWGVNWLAR